MRATPVAYVGDAEFICEVCAAKMEPVAQALLTPVMSEEECQRDDGTPDSCGVCLGYLHDNDNSYNTHPLARDIMALSVCCGDSELTQALSQARAIALNYETDTTALTERMEQWASQTRAAEVGARHPAEVAEVENLTARWCEKWNGRDIIVLLPNGDGDYIGPDGVIYRHRDTFGYLDVLEVDCEGCGRCCFNEMYEDEDGFDVRCADCVTIE